MQGYVLSAKAQLDDTVELEVTYIGDRSDIPESKVNCPDCGSFYTYKGLVNLHPRETAYFCCSCGSIFEEGRFF